MRVSVDRAARQGELQLRELRVQLAAPGPQEVAVGGGHALSDGEPRFGGVERIEAGQVTRAVAEVVERLEQAGQVGEGRCRIAAGHRVPERDRVPVHQ